ncbi:cobalamin biosynthesis protein [bacterium BMS3Bbin10]|nr:cobalamin biosynthesis protein [bacterium BMS3Bbin10]
MIADPAPLLLAAGALPVAGIALLIDRLFGYPGGLQAWIGHPVEWMGALIRWLESRLNTGNTRKAKGLLALALTLLVTAALTLPLTLFLRGRDGGWLAEALLASTLLSQKSLEDHVRAVADALRHSLEAGRAAVSHIIGRDAGALDESGVSKGALESLSENMSDGALAPLFWLLVAGLPGAALYKAINTADSMIGYKSNRYRAFGWASARADDLVNLVPSRATGWLIALAAALSSGPSARGAVGAMARDARAHASPNAGWPEAAMAGALGLRLGGPRSYGGARTDLPWMGNGRENLTREDIGDGLRLYNTGLNIATALVAAACIVMWFA